MRVDGGYVGLFFPQLGSLLAVISAVISQLPSRLISLPQLLTIHHQHSAAQTKLSSLILVQLCEFQKFSVTSAAFAVAIFQIGT
ncbi:hypothetical protein HOY82DRAFT_158247 [Tuber indicum]|nr:hypothetical protein HOY82DRAFT_158247 [Tuber indicum]